MLRDFLASWNRDRPQTTGRFGPGGTSSTADLTPVRGIAWLAAEATYAAGRNSDGSPRYVVPEATIQNVVLCRYRMTELRVADAIVTALDKPEVWHDGTLTVVPNPSAPRAAREACCAGSTDDAPPAPPRSRPASAPTC